jgi:hypothetical protein
MTGCAIGRSQPGDRALPLLAHLPRRARGRVLRIGHRPRPAVWRPSGASARVARTDPSGSARGGWPLIARNGAAASLDSNLLPEAINRAVAAGEINGVRARLVPAPRLRTVLHRPDARDVAHGGRAQDRRRTAVEVRLLIVAPYTDRPRSIGHALALGWRDAGDDAAGGAGLVVHRPYVCTRCVDPMAAISDGLSAG